MCSGNNVATEVWFCPDTRHPDCEADIFIFYCLHDWNLHGEDGRVFNAELAGSTIQNQLTNIWTVLPFMKQLASQRSIAYKTERVKSACSLCIMTECLHLTPPFPFCQQLFQQTSEQTEAMFRAAASPPFTTETHLPLHPLLSLPLGIGSSQCWVHPPIELDPAHPCCLEPSTIALLPLWSISNLFFSSAGLEHKSTSFRDPSLTPVITCNHAFLLFKVKLCYLLPITP